MIGIHVMVIETPKDGLVVVDTGFGTEAAASPNLIPWPLRAIGRPQFSLQTTAHGRMLELGLDPKDVRHIAVTHLDVDHAGGLRDFPNATVHVHQRELDAAMNRSTIKERNRYLSYQFKDVSFTSYADAGDHWFGFDAVSTLDGVDAEIALIPLFGHSRGHCGVAVRKNEGWLLHAGDAYFHHSDIRDIRDGAKRGTKPLNLFQRMVAVDNRERLANRDRLTELAAGRAEEVTVFCAHDPVELEELSQPS